MAHQASLHHELIRKSAHTLLAVGFAFVGANGPQWYVFFLAGVLLVSFSLSRSWRRARTFYTVPRISYGEFFFVAGIVVSAFLFLPHAVLAWQASMFVLAFADSLAALVGRRFGRHHYNIYGEDRTLEGSTACALTSAVLLWSFGASLPIACACAIVLTATEAIAPRGSDNFFLPVIAGTLVLLV